MSNTSTTVFNKHSSPVTLLYYCFYSQIFVFCNVKYYLPGGNGILIATAVWTFSACEQNNWIILEVILLFRRLTRMVQPVSREQICLKGLKVSAYLEMGWCVLTDPNNVNRGCCEVRQITYLGFASVCLCPGVGVSWCTYHLLTLHCEKRLQPSSTVSVWYSLCATSSPALIPYYLCFQSLLLSFCLSLCLFFVKINLRAMLPSQLATQRDTCSLCAYAVMNVQHASLSEGLFSIRWDTRREEAFNTNTTICITWNCHIPRKLMCRGWYEGGTGTLLHWLGGCWTAVGRGCCLSGELDSERWGKDLRACGPAGAVWTRPVFPVAHKCVDCRSFHVEVEGGVFLVCG